MKKSYNLKAIMGCAWAIRKAAAAEIGCKVSEIVFSLCLKQAWAEAEGVNAEINAAAVVAEWAATTPEKQVEWLQRCVVRAAKDVIGYSTEDHYHQFNECAAWGCVGTSSTSSPMRHTAGCSMPLTVCPSPMSAAPLKGCVRAL